MHTSQEHTKGAITDNAALNKAVPKANCRNPNVIGASEYCPTGNPRKIIAPFTSQYRQKITREIIKHNKRRREYLNPADPIEELIDRLED